MNLTKKLKTTTISCSLFTPAILGLMGGLSGELCDWTPYLNHAIPEGFNYFSQLVNQDIDIYRNLDKIGALVGFLYGLKPKLSIKKN